MKVLIYVEGPSDKFAMESLLKPLIERKLQHGVQIFFFEAPEGDKKKSVLLKVPQKAVNILSNDSNIIVIAMPDLYPKDKGFPHNNFSDLEKGILKNFENAAKSRGLEYSLFKDRFKVFCFKHDLEALVLAAEEELKRRLNVDTFSSKWKIPVEDQNHSRPPKLIVEELFDKHGHCYRQTVDAALILGNCNYQDIAKKCCQNFKPFVDFLEHV